MAYDLNNLRVLVVDPTPFRRMLICDVLKAIGVEQFDAVNEGSSAYNAFRGASYDVIITEQIMLP